MKNKLLATLFGAALVLGACGGGDDNAAPKDDAANDNGAATTDVDAEAVVQQSCASCHGEIHDVIVNGKGAMPPGIIQGEEADAVAAWLAEKK